MSPAKIHALAEQYAREKGFKPVDEEPLWRLAERQPTPEAVRVLSSAITAYSDARTGYEGSLTEVAFTMGLSLGLALAGKGGVR